MANAHWIKEKDLRDKAEKYRKWRKESLKETGEDMIEKHDLMDSLIIIISSLRRPSVVRVQEELDHLFQATPVGNGSGGPAGSVRLSTIHQCKGQEEDVVYLIRTDLLPHPSCTGQWQLEQEENLKYVAITRAKRELYQFCSLEAKPDAKQQLLSFARKK